MNWRTLSLARGCLYKVGSSGHEQCNLRSVTKSCRDTNRNQRKLPEMDTQSHLSLYLSRKFVDPHGPTNCPINRNPSPTTQFVVSRCQPRWARTRAFQNDNCPQFDLVRNMRCDIDTAQCSCRLPCGDRVLDTPSEWDQPEIHTYLGSHSPHSLVRRH